MKQKNTNMSLQVIYFLIAAFLSTYSFAKEKEQINLLLEKAKNGDLVATYKLGLIFYNGNNVTRDLKKAEIWFHEAAQKGKTEAYFYLGELYFKKQKYFKAAKWFKKSAKTGEVNAQFYLGLMHMKGHGVQKDYYKAIKLYKIAANKGNARAQCSLGTLYSLGLTSVSFSFFLDRGLPLPKDSWNLKAALILYRQSAKQGYNIAQYKLGKIYLAGKGIPRDIVKAKKWISKAAENGNEEAKRLIHIINDL